MKNFLKQTFLYTYWRKIKDQMAYKKWLADGKAGAPPHLVKEQAVAEYAKIFGCECLVETGTFLGDMIAAMRKNFKQLYSIELDSALYNRAVKKFSRYGDIQILQGDSGRVINELLPKLPAKTLFWLDGHYSAGITARAEVDTPINNELKAILTSQCKNSVILIDDARMFVGSDGYPTLDGLKNLVFSLNPTLKMEVKNDIIRLTPPQ